MLKKRIVASLIVQNGIVVQSIYFSKYLPVGKPSVAIEFLNQWGIDEILFLDISSSRKNVSPDFNLIKKASHKCYVPLTVGGGITSLDHISDLMHCGADKISLNQTALMNPKFISDAANVFGNQCIVVSIDAILENNQYKVYDYINKKTVNISPSIYAKQAENMGAGEILINSVDRDGSYLGYDTVLINSVCDKVKIPVICCGGAKNAKDFIDVFSKTNASAACAGNFFHFTEHSVNITKSIVKKEIQVRLETHADYKDAIFNDSFRLFKKSDQILEEMLFMHIEKEVI